VARLVSDEVWQQLDPNAGRLPRRTTNRMRYLGVVAVIAAVGIGAVWRTGVFEPRLEHNRHAGRWASASPVPERTIERSVTVINRGWVPLTIVGAGRDGPGLELTGVQAAFPVTLGRGEEVEFAVAYRVTDCAAVPREPWPVPVRVRMWYGERTVEVELPTESGPDAPDAYQYTGPDPYGVEWQWWLADLACNPRP